ncbi:MAG: YraN family protein [Candidatus Kapaibacterium sp.]|nr:YraN family protein [Ignavibacteriota bacterium]MCB9221583.1 YraN family protein [Ignavibacteria bacterium]
MDNTQVGHNFEELAEDYLIKKGYKIIKRNFHYGKLGEIDIVAEIDNILVFCEVKGRNNNNFGTAIESVTYGKQMKLRKAAEGYLNINKITDKDCRMDLIAIDIIAGKPQITHLENAF